MARRAALAARHRASCGATASGPAGSTTPRRPPPPARAGARGAPPLHPPARGAGAHAPGRAGAARPRSARGGERPARARQPERAAGRHGGGARHHRPPGRAPARRARRLPWAQTTSRRWSGASAAARNRSCAPRPSRWQPLLREHLLGAPARSRAHVGRASRSTATCLFTRARLGLERRERARAGLAVRRPGPGAALRAARCARSARARLQSAHPTRASSLSASSHVVSRTV